MLVAPANTEREAGQDIFEPNQIKARIAERGTSVTAIARKIKKARNTVSLSIHHRDLYPAVRRKVLKHLDLL